MFQLSSELIVEFFGNPRPDGLCNCCGKPVERITPLFRETGLCKPCYDDATRAVEDLEP